MKRRAGRTGLGFALGALTAALALPAGRAKAEPLSFGGASGSPPTIVTERQYPSSAAGAAQAPKEPSVFDLDKPSGPKTTKGAPGGADRYVGEDPDYYSSQRDQWIEECEGKKRISMEAFRACFQGRKRRNRDQLRRSFDAVERRMKPGNVGPAEETGGLPENALNGRLPAGTTSEASPADGVPREGIPPDRVPSDAGPKSDVERLPSGKD